ncbi:hypothetical protein HID58_060760 [Brassica napus]|uniref:Uncharacterized protein n=1 Tax=Brassica napus TaxID=3708 RepID=A0ABQ7ZWR2_BRANA|nr:hypothetical protein HID58_060760 [Brassica napus]
MVCNVGGSEEQKLRSSAAGKCSSPSGYTTQRMRRRHQGDKIVSVGTWKKGSEARKERVDIESSKESPPIFYRHARLTAHDLKNRGPQSGEHDTKDAAETSRRQNRVDIESSKESPPIFYRHARLTAHDLRNRGPQSGELWHRRYSKTEKRSSDETFRKRVQQDARVQAVSMRGGGGRDASPSFPARARSDLT